MEEPLPIWRRISERRRISIERGEENAASNIDTNRSFDGPLDIGFYLPRALEIGLFAPFPNMWFVNGTRVGFSGRLLSGGEMILTYFFQLGALISLLYYRRHLPIWLVFAIILIGHAGLGLMVVNVGTLYRLRYPFWILLILLGIAGWLRILKEIGFRYNTPLAPDEDTRQNSTSVPGQ